MARTVLTREIIATLDDDILRKNNVTREDLIKDLVDFKITLNDTYGGIIHWYKLPFLKRADNRLQELGLTRTQAGAMIAALGLVTAITVGWTSSILSSSNNMPSTESQIELALSKGDYDTCNDFVSNAMVQLNEFIQTTDGTQKNYYLGMLGEMEGLRLEVTRSYHDYEEAKALGIDASQALMAYQSAFQDFVTKSETIGIYYVAEAKTLNNDGPKLG